MGVHVRLRRARPAGVRGGGNETYLYGNPANPFQVTATVVGGVVTSYYYDAEDRLFAFERGGERYYVGADAMGSPRVVVRASDGAVVRRVDLRLVRRRDRGGRRRSTSRSATRAACAMRHRPRPLRPARLRPGVRPLRGPRPELLRRQPGEPLRLRRQQPDHPEGPDRAGVRRLVDVRAVGGGFRSAATTSGTGTADWCVCGEAGLGLGGGVDVDFVGAPRTPAARCSPR